jgi:hypothetical protein
MAWWDWALIFWAAFATVVAVVLGLQLALRVELQEALTDNNGTSPNDLLEETEPATSLIARRPSALNRAATISRRPALGLRK